MSQAATAGAGYVIRCAGVDGAYGQPAPAGLWLLSFDPDAVDPTGTFRGLAEWTTLSRAWRFPSEAAAAACVEAGLCKLYRTRIEAVPAAAPPVIDGRFARAAGQDLTEDQRAEAQAVIDRLWADGYLR